ncbi:hypothetical protein ACFL1S_04465 [Pseudomonadota bacterium]
MAPSTHEKVYGEFKGGFAFDSVSGQEYGANSAWQWFSFLEFSLTGDLHWAKTAKPRTTNHMR